ncbi:ATP-dependent DNA helicase [Mycoplasmopsis gallinarum]|uniref:ATP-dependent DNA helicase n=1 Tax=Mycoplasmopsis gallinarum TaxID=29557 RepID=UPI00048A2A73|nr:ATP-dependent RecD-like DNA helicase [Mycoplasmopsis gallinarum]
MDKTNQKFIGKFTKILSGGASKEWKYTFALFEYEGRKKIPVYIKGKEIELFIEYEIYCLYNELKETWNLEEIKLHELKNTKLEVNILKKVEGFGFKKLELLKNKYGDNWIENSEKNNFYAEDLGNKIAEKLKKELNKINDNKIYKYFIENSLISQYDKIVSLTETEDLIQYFKKNDIFDLFINFGFDFETNLKIAVLLKESPLISISSYSFYRAFIYLYIYENFKNNNTLISLSKNMINYVDTEIEKLNTLIKVDRFDIYDVLIEMIKRNEILQFKSEKGILKLTTFKMYEKEKYILNYVKNLILLSNNKKEIKEFPKSLSEKQGEAYLKAINKNFSIISGFPGTGKTYILNEIYNTLLTENKYKKSEVQILTPTGKAGSNITTKFGILTKTIHSFLKIDKDEGLMNLKNYETNENVKVIIIDEFSMVNIDLFYLLLTSCKEIEKVILIGDHNQLPCIGPGNMLSEFVNSDQIEKTKLTEIFRTDCVDICEHFLNIKNNIEPNLNTENVKFYEQNSIEFLNFIEYKYEEEVKKYSIENVTILCPTNRFVDKINEKLQKWNNEFFNFPDENFNVLFGDKPLFIGDKIIQIVNNYEKNVFNGEIGYFKDFINGNFIFKINNKEVEYTKAEIKENIKLAYAITVHKFQGSESNSIIFTVFKEFEKMLKNQLLYTAVSRAKKELHIFGDSYLYINKITDVKNNYKIETNMKLLLEEN